MDLTQLSDLSLDQELDKFFDQWWQFYELALDFISFIAPWVLITSLIVASVTCMRVLVTRRNREQFIFSGWYLAKGLAATIEKWYLSLSPRGETFIWAVGMSTVLATAITIIFAYSGYRAPLVIGVLVGIGFYSISFTSMIFSEEEKPTKIKQSQQKKIGQKTELPDTQEIVKSAEEGIRNNWKG